MDTTDPDEVNAVPFDTMPRRMTVPVYTKQNCEDNILDSTGDFTQYILSLSHKTHVGIHIDSFNTECIV